MNSIVHWSGRAFALVVLSILASGLISCGLTSEAKLEIPVKPAHEGLINPCAVAALEKMGFDPIVTAGPSGSATVITASEHAAVVASTPAVLIDVAAEGCTRPVRVTVKGVGGPIPVSESALKERSAEFASLFNACLN
jgi:hypothetical protein